MKGTATVICTEFSEKYVQNLATAQKCQANAHLMATYEADVKFKKKSLRELEQDISRIESAKKGLSSQYDAVLTAIVQIMKQESRILDSVRDHVSATELSLTKHRTASNEYKANDKGLIDLETDLCEWHERVCD